MSRLHVYHDNSSSGGVGFTSLLQIAFIALKLCKVIDWSWWYVLLPTIIPFGLVGLAAIIVSVSFIIAVVKDE